MVLHGDTDCGSPDNVPYGIGNKRGNQESDQPGGKKVNINLLSGQFFTGSVVGLGMHPLHEPQVFYQKENAITNHSAGHIHNHIGHIGHCRTGEAENL